MTFSSQTQFIHMSGAAFIFLNLWGFLYTVWEVLVHWLGFSACLKGFLSFIGQVGEDFNV